MAGERGAVLLADLIVVAWHAGQVEQYCEPRRALYQGANRRAAQSDDEIPLPVARHCPVGRFRRALADHDLRGEVGFATSAAARPRHAQRPPGPQTGGQLAPQRASALHVQCLVDGLVADAHRLIAGKVEPQPLSDLLRAPRPGPLPVLPPPLPTALPGHDRPAEGSPAGDSDHAGQPVLHISLQRRVDRQFRWLRAAGGPVGVPLRGRRPVVQATAARGGVAAQLPRDRRGRPPQPASHLPYLLALRATQRDLLPLRERQIPPAERLRRGRKRCWWHATRLPKPPCPHRRRYTRAPRGALARQARRNRRPEPLPILTPRHPWSTRRTQNTSPGPIRAPLPSAHRNPFVQVLRRPLESAQYTSLAFGKRCKEAGVRPSMGSVGDAYDNALCESFFATLECELLERRRFASQVEA